MIISHANFREQLRVASEALSRAELAVDYGVNIYAQLGVSDARLKQVRQGLIQNARKHLASAAETALNTLEPAGLPGLPQGRAENEGALRAGEAALAAVWSSLAELETLRGAKDASIASYRKATELAPDDLVANAQLADLLESRHDLAKAKAHAVRALRADPANFTASMALARVLMRQEQFVEAERTAMTATKAARASNDERALAWSLVGEARDRRGNNAEAFNAFTQANKLMLQRYGQLQEASHPAHPANVRRLTEVVARAPVSDTAARFATSAPAFLIGFPRSGTTLAEQILSSHSGVTCLGETEYLFAALSVVLRDGDLFDRIATLSREEIESVRAAYQRVVLADHPEAAGKMIVDKHPLHIVLLPVINKIFPDAKIIFTQRDPRDVVFSCYQQCFGMNVATAQFLELERTAAYYDAVMELMLTCREKLKLDLLQIEYRDIVADLEREAQQMAGFLGLAFDPAMLRYDETALTRTISSASARQVINPIYNRSVARWRRYARELAPVLPLLNKWARRLGYEE